VLAAQKAMDGNIELTGLLDFGNARAGDALLDLAKALMCCTHEDPTSREPLLAGYGELSHPAPGEALWVYTLFHRVIMWTYLERLGGRPRRPPSRPGRDEQVAWLWLRRSADGPSLS